MHFFLNIIKTERSDMNMLRYYHTRVVFYIVINSKKKKNKVLVLYIYLAYLAVIDFYFHSNHMNIELKYKKYN